MRIALVTPGFSANDEDWCIPALQDLACRLAEHHNVHVFTTTYPHRCSDFRVKGVPVSSFGDGRTGRLALMRRMWKTVAAIESAHRDNPFDVLQGFFADQGGVVTSVAARRMFVPNVVTVMAGELTYEPLIGYGKCKRPIAGRLARFAARRADILIANSRYHADRIESEQSTLEPTVIPFGVDTERFSREGRVQTLDGEIPVLCAASLVPVKCHAILFEAFKLASTQVDGLHLHLVGKGELEKDLRHKVQNLGISHSVTFHGHVEHDILPAYYRAASFCVLGSCFEGHGMVVLEAAACGRVTIGSDVGSMPEFCPADFLNQPGDAAALAANIHKVATDTDFRMRLTRKAAAKVYDGYTLDQAVQVLEELYRQYGERS